MYHIVSHLYRLTKLSLLDLRHTEITDAGLFHLLGLTQLSSLYLNNTIINKCKNFSLINGSRKLKCC